MAQKLLTVMIGGKIKRLITSKDNEIAVMKKALNFYAAEENWKSPMGLPKAREDQGDIARAAIAMHKGAKP